MRRFIRLPATALALAALSLSAVAQQNAPLNDPANLAGERVSAPALADTLPINHGAPALAQLLLKLRTRASLMFIVAHPDDEDGGMLTYESRGQGARVAMLTLTRGEGGQNLMSADFNDALGLIRTQELLAADRYMGVDQFFGTEVDFGFSKTREETLQQWTHDRVLYDAVRAVRLYRPLVLASTWVGGVTDGHGHHQVSGEITQEVFAAAADPKVFPEMIAEGLLPWAPLKVFARTPSARMDPQGMFDYATGKYSPPHFHNYVTNVDSATPLPAAVVIHEGETSNAPGIDGQSFIGFARKGLALQKSQNGGASRGPGTGVFDSAYALYGTRLGCPDGLSTPIGCPTHPDSGMGGLQATATKPADNFFEGIDTTLPGIADLVPEAPKLREALTAVDNRIAEAQRLFSIANPELTAPPLRAALGALDSLIQEISDPAIGDLPDAEKYDILHELRIKRVQLNNALVLAHGLTLEATLVAPAPAQTLLTTDQHIAADLKLTYPGDQPLQITNTSLEAFGAKLNPTSPAKTPIPAHNSPTARLKLEIASGLPATRPYFSRTGLAQPFYNIADPSLRDAPSTPPALVAHLTLNDQGVELQLAATVAFPLPKDATTPRQPVTVVPPVSVDLPVGAAVVSVDKDTFPLSYTATTSNPDSAPELRLELPPLWSYTTPGPANLPRPTPPPAGRLSHQTAEVLPDQDAQPYRPYPITVVAELDHRTYREGFRAVGYPGLQSTTLYTASTFHVTAADLTTAPKLGVAYLPGTGDDVPAYLPDLGITPTILSVADLTPAKLAGYDAIVLGVRAYAAHPELAGAGSRPLIDYARKGGVVIVQYNTARYADAESPYPITVPGSSDMNVVEEADPVTLLAPAAPVFLWPNHITSADFNGWVEERGHGFARTWAPEFQALLETHDPGQDPERGGLLLAHVGKGYYVYTALALYRQLPEGVPGAYRLLANLLSLGRNPNH